MDFRIWVPFGIVCFLFGGGAGWSPVGESCFTAAAKKQHSNEVHQGRCLGKVAYFQLAFFFLKSQDVATSHFHNSVPTLEFANAAPRNVRVVSTALLHLVIFDPLPVFGGVP